MRITFNTLSRYMAMLPDFMRDSRFGTTLTGRLKKSLGPSDGPGEFSTIVEAEVEDALLVTAKTEDDDYRLILDIDGLFEAKRSSGRGYHLFFGNRLTKEQHDAIIVALRDAGIIQKAWANSAIASDLGATLRAPWVYKGRDRTMRQQASQ